MTHRLIWLIKQGTSCQKRKLFISTLAKNLSTLKVDESACDFQSKRQREFELSHQLSFLFGTRLYTAPQHTKSILSHDDRFSSDLSAEWRIDTALFVIQLRKQQCDINETLFCSGWTEYFFIEIAKHQGRLQLNKIPPSKSHFQQNVPFLSGNF